MIQYTKLILEEENQMTDKQREMRLKELNQKCIECQDKARKNFETINPINCGQFCKIGREVHKLENGDWNKVDWNSSKYEDLYRH